MSDQRSDQPQTRTWWERNASNEIYGVMIGAIIFGFIGILIGDSTTASLGFSMGGGIGYAVSHEIWNQHEHATQVLPWTIGGLIAGAVAGGLLGYWISTTSFDITPDSVTQFLGIAFGAAIGCYVMPLLVRMQHSS